MEQLIQEAVVTAPRALLAETIDLVAVLVRDGTGRRLSELARVEGLDPATGAYRLVPHQPQGERSCSVPPGMAPGASFSLRTGSPSRLYPLFPPTRATRHCPA